MTYLLLGQDLQEPSTCGFAAGQAAVFSHRSPHKEHLNEDAAALIACGDGRGVIAVADGCGGMASGQDAARLAIEWLERSLAGGPPDVRSAILDAIDKANRDVRQLGVGAATTLAAVEIDRRKIRTYHIGDSQILVVGSHGKVKLQTRAHSPVGYAIEAGVLSEEEAIHHEERHLVSNVLGSPDTHIELGPRRKLAQRDTLLVGSDGLFDNLHGDEIVEIIRKGPLVRAARRLVELATRRMSEAEPGVPSKPDDVTFVLYRQATPRPEPHPAER
jgi:serine/threonine protein phosphatase PrpC